MKIRPLTREIPEHLMKYITQQDPTLYTSIDQACWRYILKLSREFFETHAHQKYLDGLRETGISLERIPLIEEMDTCLRKFNWRAVSVAGFIPSAAFMEFLSLGILPIACDMRKLENLAYTPAPDIVHEAAGHAPIIADPEYADYLRSYGEISKKAIASLEDLNVYEAIRHLSETKEDPHATQESVDAAQRGLNEALAAVTYTSEATQLSRMGWWTFEYGLFGPLSEPKIYGAGLLSSLSESFHCFDPAVKKIRFSIDCTEVAFDITRPQPQLFVAPNFPALRDTLMALGDRMAFRRGGLEGLRKALQCKTITTTTLDSGIQMSGVLSQIHHNAAGEPVYLNYKGPTQLSYEDQEIPEQGTRHHSEGFGTPLATVTTMDLQRWNIQEGEMSELALESGVKIRGRLVRKIEMNQTLLILTFENCTVNYEGKTLFQPEWGLYDMVCGKTVTSVFGGPADREAFGHLPSLSHTLARAQKTNQTQANQVLGELYAQVRGIRERPSSPLQDLRQIESIYQKLASTHPQDWLLRYEILEWLSDRTIQVDWKPQLILELEAIAQSSRETGEIIHRGMEILNRNVSKASH